MIELGKDIFFGGIALIFICVVGYLIFGLIAGAIIGLLQSDESSAFISNCIKIFNPVAVFKFLKNARDSGNGHTGCLALVFLIPFYLIIFIILFSLVRDFVIPLLK